MNIDFIYFDVGGVVVRDFSKTSKWDEMLDDLGLKGEARQKFEKLFDEREAGFCRGEDVDTLVPVLRNEFGLKLDDGYSMLTDFVSRNDENPRLGKIIEQLEGRVPIGLLTNMYPRLLDGIRERGLLPEVRWDSIVDSSTAHFLKPEPEIYELAARQANTDPARILFVENSPMHIDGAKAHGWQTLLYDPADVADSNDRLVKLLSRITNSVL